VKLPHPPFSPPRTRGVCCFGRYCLLSGCRFGHSTRRNSLFLYARPGVPAPFFLAGRHLSLLICHDQFFLFLYLPLCQLIFWVFLFLTSLFLFGWGGGVVFFFWFCPRPLPFLFTVGLASLLFRSLLRKRVMGMPHFSFPTRAISIPLFLHSI